MYVCMYIYIYIYIYITQYNRVCTFGPPCIPRVHFSDRPPDQIELFAWDIPHFLALRRGQICEPRDLQIHQNWPFRVRHPSKRELRSGADSEDAPACQTCKLCFSQGTSRTFSLSRTSSPHIRSTRTRSSSRSNRAFRVGHPSLLALTDKLALRRLDSHTFVFTIKLCFSRETSPTFSLSWTSSPHARSLHAGDLTNKTSIRTT